MFERSRKDGVTTELVWERVFRPLAHLVVLVLVAANLRSLYRRGCVDAVEAVPPAEGVGAWLAGSMPRSMRRRPELYLWLVFACGVALLPLELRREVRAFCATRSSSISGPTRREQTCSTNAGM